MDNFTKVKKLLRIEDVISEDVDLKKSGRDLKACCPFHDEKTASFTVFRESQDFHCFGCGAHGTVIDYIMQRIKTNSPSEALLYISDRYKIAMDGMDTETFKRQGEIKQQKRNKAATNMKAVPKVPEAMDFLKSRGFTPETYKVFGIGYDMNEQAVTIPFLNTHGEVVGNTYRYFAPDKPKYKNDAQDEVFNKSELLYGLDKARKQMNKRLYVMEGYFDVLAAYQMNVASVAYCSSSITDGQVELLKNYIPENVKIYLVPDNDKTGRKEAVKNAQKLTGRLKNRIGIVELPDGIKDANDLLLSGKTLVDIQATPSDLYFLKQELNQCLEIEDEYEVAYQYGQRIQSPMLKREIAKYLAGRWKESIETVSEHLKTPVPAESLEKKFVNFTDGFLEFTKEVMEGDKRSIKFQLKEIDDLIPKGMRKAELIYLMGRSGSGKTTLANNLKYSAFHHQKKNVLDFSLELYRTAMIPQFMQIHMDWTEKQVENMIRKSEWSDELSFLQKEMDERYLLVDEPVTLEDIRTYIRLANERRFSTPVDLVVIDYFGTIKLPGKDNPYNERSNLARELKEVAKEFNTTILCLTQTNRDGGADGSERLTLQSSRDTGAIEESADYVLGVYRPALSPKVEGHERVAVEKEMRIQVLKARWGRVGETLAEFDGARKTVKNWSGTIPDPRGH